MLLVKKIYKHFKNLKRSGKNKDIFVKKIVSTLMIKKNI